MREGPEGGACGSAGGEVVQWTGGGRMETGGGGIRTRKWNRTGGMPSTEFTIHRVAGARTRDHWPAEDNPARQGSRP